MCEQDLAEFDERCIKVDPQMPSLEEQAQRLARARSRQMVLVPERSRGFHQRVADEAHLSVRHAEIEMRFSIR